MTRTAIVFIKDALPKAKKGDIPYVYVGDPSPEDYSLEWKDPQYTLHVPVPNDIDYRALKVVFNQDGSFSGLTNDPVISATIKQRAKSAQIQNAYQRMDLEIFDRMQTVFGTRRADSATAFIQTWALMKEKPQMFAGQPGIVSDAPVAGLVTGQPLSTSQQVVDFASARLAMADAFAVYRMQRITQYIFERSQILAAP